MERAHPTDPAVLSGSTGSAVVVASTLDTERRDELDRGGCEGRLRTLIDLVPLSYFTKLRSTPKQYDIHFVVSYWGPVHEEANEFRLELMERLHRVPGLKVFTGFASKEPLPGRFEKYRTEFTDLRTHLRRLARSRIAVYVRGMHECLSYKFAQHLGLGLPVVGQRLVMDQAWLCELPHFEAQYAYDDAAALVARIAELVERPEEQAALGAANARTFDTCLTPAACMGQALARIWPESPLEIA